MSDDTGNATIEILRSIQDSISDFRAESNARFEQIQTLIRKERCNSVGTLVMMRATAGHFAACMQSLESRVAAREATA